MKYLRQENNRFIFEDGGEELDLFSNDDGEYEYSGILIDFSLYIATFDNEKEPYKDIQTAVQMMTILKEKGLV